MAAIFLLFSLRGAGCVYILYSQCSQGNYTPDVVPASSAGLISNLPLPTSVVPASSAGQIPYLSSYFAKLDEII